MDGKRFNEFKDGDKVKCVNPYLHINSIREPDDIYTIRVEVIHDRELVGAISDRTGIGYVVANGDYDFA